MAKIHQHNLMLFKYHLDSFYLFKYNIRLYYFRCKAVYRPFDRPSGLSRSQALFTTCLIWMIALMLTIPWAVVFNVTDTLNSLPYCSETWENEYNGKLYFLIANFLLCYCSPLLLISISNLAIWCHVTHRKVPQDSASAGPIKKMHKKARHGVLKMLGVVTLAFLISWLPLYIIVMRMKFGENISDYEFNLLDFLMPFAQWLGSTNSCINPVLYAFLNKKFREMFKSLCPSWCPCARRNNLVLMARYQGARTCTVTNGTFEGTTNGTPSHTSVYTARSSSNSCSRRPQHNSCGGRSVVVGNFKEMGRASTRVMAVQTATTSVVVSVGATSGTRSIRNTSMRTEKGTVTDL